LQSKQQTMSNSFVKDTSDPLGSFVKNFSDNTSPADADSPHKDLAAVPGTIRTDEVDVATETLKPGGPLANVPFDANKGIERFYYKVQERFGGSGGAGEGKSGDEVIERTYEKVQEKAAETTMPDANKAIENAYDTAQKKAAQFGQEGGTPHHQTHTGALATADAGARTDDFREDLTLQ